MSRVKQKSEKRRRPKRPPGKRPLRARAAPQVDDGPQRLQKVLAAAGVASRRECEQLILDGRVEIDRHVVSRLGTKVDADTQEIRVDGVALKQAKPRYYLVNKPRGVVSTNRDPAGRPRVVDMVPDRSARLFTVGRLDIESEGLILLTNDGELANRLAHPRYGVEKIYQVQVAGLPDREVLKKLRDGFYLAETRVQLSRVQIKSRHKQSAILEVVLREVKNREIRRMLAAVGHKVQRLRRVAIGPLKIGKLPLGEVRVLTPAEVASLRDSTRTEKSKRGTGKGRRR